MSALRVGAIRLSRIGASQLARVEAILSPLLGAIAYGVKRLALDTLRISTSSSPLLTDIAPLSKNRRWLSGFGEVLAAWRDSGALKPDPPRSCCRQA
jgi:hypothetical protein